MNFFLFLNYGKSTLNLIKKSIFLKASSRVKSLSVFGQPKTLQSKGFDFFFLRFQKRVFEGFRGFLKGFLEFCLENNIGQLSICANSKCPKPQIHSVKIINGTFTLTDAKIVTALVIGPQEKFDSVIFNASQTFDELSMFASFGVFKIFPVIYGI